MGVQNKNSTNYVHPDEPNLLNLHKAMNYNDAGEPVLRTHVDGITLQGDVIVDKVKLWDGTNTLVFDSPSNDGETAPPSLPAESHNMVFNGTTWDRMRGTINDGILAKITNFPTSVGTTFTNTSIDVGNFPTSFTANQGTAGTSAWKVDIGTNGTVTANVTFPSIYKVSRNTSDNSDTNRIYVDTGLTIPPAFDGEIKNDTGNPIPISATTATNSTANPIYVQGSVTISAQPESATFEFTSKNRLKISTYQTVFFNTFQYSKETDVWDESTTNGGTATYNADQSNVELKVTNQSGSKVIRQTFNTQRYIPGRTSTLNFAVRMQTPVAGIRRRFGLFDERDGCFFEDAGDGNYYCVLRSYASGSLVENRKSRAEWNGDKLDGTGLSGITANPEAIHMFGVEYEWYGAGQVKFVYIIGGVSHTIHTFNTANVASLPWSTTPFLPIRLEIENTTGGQARDSYMWQGSNSLISEGVPEKLGIAQSITSPLGGTSLTTKDTFYPVLSIRLKSSALRGIVLPSFFQAASTDNTNIYYKLVRNATLTGASWTDMPDTNAFTQYDVSATAFSGGVQIDSGFVFGSSGGTRIPLDQNTTYQLGRSSLGTVSDTYTLCVASSIANKSAVAQMTWIEQR